MDPIYRAIVLIDIPATHLRYRRRGGRRRRLWREWRGKGWQVWKRRRPRRGWTWRRGGCWRNQKDVHREDVVFFPQIKEDPRLFAAKGHTRRSRRVGARHKVVILATGRVHLAIVKAARRKNSRCTDLAEGRWVRHWWRRRGRRKLEEGFEARGIKGAQICKESRARRFLRLSGIFGAIFDCPRHAGWVAKVLRSDLDGGRLRRGFRRWHRRERRWRRTLGWKIRRERGGGRRRRRQRWWRWGAWKRAGWQPWGNWLHGWRGWRRHIGDGHASRLYNLEPEAASWGLLKWAAFHPFNVVIDCLFGGNKGARHH